TFERRPSPAFGACCRHPRSNPAFRPTFRDRRSKVDGRSLLGYISQIVQRKPTSKPRVGQALAIALERVLRPLFRIVLRNNMSFKAFLDIAKHTYVQVAASEFRIPGKKQSVSRIALLSGLTRKEVQRLLDAPAANDKNSEAGERYNRAARVVAGWVRDKDFCDATGHPKVLALQDGGGENRASFAELVRRFSGDIPFRAVLDELLRVGVVEKFDDGNVHLKTRAYIPESGDTDKLNILGMDVSDLVATIDHNIQHGVADPFFQRKVMYDNVPAEALEEFRRLSGSQAQALLARLNKSLCENERHSYPRTIERRRERIGKHYLIEDTTSQTSKETQS